VGGLDFNVNPNFIGGLEAIGAVCTDEEMQKKPDSALKPFNSDSAGTVIGDGGAVFVMMTEKFRETLMKDGQNVDVLCEVAGYSEVCDAHHILRPLDDGEGMRQSMQNAL